MGEFNVNTDWNKKLAGLYKYFKYFFPELQLVWLYEILITKVYYILVRENLASINKRTGNYRLRESDVIEYLKKYEELYVPFKILANYRKSFVHEGSAPSMRSLRAVYRNKESINGLAELAEVSINWNCSCTDMLTKDSSYLQ